MRISLYDFGLTKWAKVYIFFAILVLQSVIILCYSAQTATQSAEMSRAVMKILEWIPEIIPKEESDGKYGGITLHFIVRKLAHMYNYFVAGCILCAIRHHFEKGSIKDLMLVGYGLFLGGIDEVFQHFVPGRSGQITDVCIDFTGTMIGYIAVYILFSLIISKRCILWERAERK
jgi:VanZ family protein